MVRVCFSQSSHALCLSRHQLRNTIDSLTKDIAGLKREIRERDDTIGDKETRIFDLKKKNQELEKFKFVLDYKITELKKLIEPREQEVADLKDQIREMDRELERYHAHSAELELTIANAQLKIEGYSREVLAQRHVLSTKTSAIRRFERDVLETSKHITGDPKVLKESVKQLFAKHATVETPAEGAELDETQREWR